MKFGQYELLEHIAVGGMAEVFKGRVVGGGRLREAASRSSASFPTSREDERFVKMLLTEARIHSALSHRNIVQIHDLGISEEGEYFIVLEYVEGYDLRVSSSSCHGAGEIDPRRRCRCTSPTELGAGAALRPRAARRRRPAAGHRPPRRLALERADLVRGRGEAVRLRPRQAPHRPLGGRQPQGKPRVHVARAGAQATLDRRTDVFSLGAVLFEMLTGRRCARSPTRSRAGARSLRASCRRRGSSGPICRCRSSLLDRALAADPAERFPDAARSAPRSAARSPELNIPVGASDLAALLGVMTPPRRAHAEHGTVQGDSPRTQSRPPFAKPQRARPPRRRSAAIRSRPSACPVPPVRLTRLVAPPWPRQARARQ